MTSAMGYWATHRPQVNYTLSLCACVLTHVCMCSLGPPIVLGKLHTWVSPYVSSETTQPSAPLRLSHGTHMCSCCHHSLCYAHTHTHTDNLTVWQLLGNITLQAADSWSWTGTYQSLFNSVILCGVDLAVLLGSRVHFQLGPSISSHKCLDKSIHQMERVGQ